MLIGTLDLPMYPEKSASTVAAPEIIDPMIAIDGTTPFGNCRLMSDDTKIAATGNTITK
jgi:hypothetical protein